MTTILVVDDRPTNREFLTTLFGYSGYQILEAANGEEALALVRAEKPDLVITDFLMPVMDGYELARQMRSDPAISQTPLIFYSATYNEQEARTLAKAAGVTYVLHKPAEPQLILNMVQAALGHSPGPLPTPIETRRLMDPVLIVAGKMAEKMGELGSLNRRLAGLVDLGLKVTLERDPQRLLQLVCDEARQIVGARYAAVALLAGDGKTLKYFLTSGLDPETIQRIGELPCGKGVLGKLLTENRPLRLPDISADPDSVGFPAGHPPMRSFLGAPIATPVIVYGRLYLTEKIDAEEFSEEDEDLVVALAAQVAVAYENARLYNELQSYAASLQLEIIERRKAQVALQVSERKFRALVEHSADAIAVNAPDGTVLYVSPSVEKITGIHAKVGEKVNPFERIHPDDLEVSRNMLERIRQSPRTTVFVQFRIQHPDGEWRWVEVAGTNLVGEPGVDGIVVNFADITERRRAEEAVRASEEQYRGLFEDSPISLWVEDFSEVKLRLDQLRASGVEDIPAYLREHPEFVLECAHQIKILDVNSAALKMYHALSKAELLGPLMEIMPTIPAEQLERELIRLASGHLNFEREGVEETLTGEKIHISLRWTVVPGYEDTLARVIVSTIDVTERKRAEEQVQLQFQRLRALRSIDLAISSSYNLNLTLDILLNQVLTQLKVDAASVLLLQPLARKLEYAAGRGFHSSAIRGASVRLGDGYAGIAALERRTIHSTNLTETNRDLPPVFLLMLREEGFSDYYCVPLIVKGEVKGVLEIYHRSVLKSDYEWLDFLDALAGQAAIAIEDATLFENLQRSNQDLFQAYDATIEGWSHALDLRDEETEGHTQRVTELTIELARRFGFTPEQLINIRWGALLHDIGKMGVPDNILLKPDKLTDEEWEVMRKHPTFAYEMLSPITYLKSSLDIPYCHHEKWDGTGYPRGLKGELIPLAARLFAVVDVWDALRSDRPYRKAWSIERTIEHIRSLSGTHFDPVAVQHFLEMVEGGRGT